MLVSADFHLDGHNDLPWTIREDPKAPMDVDAYDLRKTTSGETDVARLRQGQLRAQFWSIYVPGETKEGYAKVQLEQFDIARRMIARYPEAMELALSVADVPASPRRARWRRCWAWKAATCWRIRWAPCASTTASARAT